MNPKAITFVKVERPNKELVHFLYKNFTFSDNSMLADFSKLYQKIPDNKKIHFTIVFATLGNKILGWGIVSENLAKQRKGDDYKDILQGRDSLLMLFVGPRYRKMGVASGIFNLLIKSAPYRHIITIGHDKISFNFFSKFRIIHKRKITIIDWR